MTAPNECPIPANQLCPHTGTLAQLQTNIGGMLECLKDLRDDMKDVKKSVSTITILEQGQNFHKEALERAFRKIESIDEAVENHEKTLQQFEGMKKLAIVLWTVLASGLGVVLMKVFQL